MCQNSAMCQKLDVVAFRFWDLNAVVLCSTKNRLWVSMSWVYGLCFSIPWLSVLRKNVRFQYRGFIVPDFRCRGFWY